MKGLLMLKSKMTKTQTYLKKGVLGLVIYAFVALLVFNFDIIADNQQPRSKTTKEPIKIGVYLPLTGSLANFGESTRAGIELAKDEVNQSGGIFNRQIEFVIE